MKRNGATKLPITRNAENVVTSRARVEKRLERKVQRDNGVHIGGSNSYSSQNRQDTRSSRKKKRTPMKTKLPSMIMKV